MKTLKIEIPKGYEVDTNKSTFENIIFKEIKKEITERIKTIEGAIEELGEKDVDVIELRKLQSINIVDYILNNQIAVVITKALNEGWVSNWDDTNEYKYFPWFYLGKNFRYNDFNYWTSYCRVSARLCFKSSELAIYAGKQFKEVYKKFMN